MVQCNFGAKNSRPLHPKTTCPPVAHNAEHDTFYLYPEYQLFVSKISLGASFPKRFPRFCHHKSSSK